MRNKYIYPEYSLPLDLSFYNCVNCKFWLFDFIQQTFIDFLSRSPIPATDSSVREDTTTCLIEAVAEAVEVVRAEVVRELLSVEAEALVEEEALAEEASTTEETVVEAEAENIVEEAIAEALVTEVAERTIFHIVTPREGVTEGERTSAGFPGWPWWSWSWTWRRKDLQVRLCSFGWGRLN